MKERGSKPKTCVLAVHGIADQKPGESLESVAALLRVNRGVTECESLRLSYRPEEPEAQGRRLRHQNAPDVDVFEHHWADLSRVGGGVLGLSWALIKLVAQTSFLGVDCIEGSEAKSLTRAAAKLHLFLLLFFLPSCFCMMGAALILPLLEGLHLEPILLVMGFATVVTYVANLGLGGKARYLATPLAVAWLLSIVFSLCGMKEALQASILVTSQVIPLLVCLDIGVLRPYQNWCLGNWALMSIVGICVFWPALKLGYLNAVTQVLELMGLFTLAGQFLILFCGAFVYLSLQYSSRSDRESSLRAAKRTLLWTQFVAYLLLMFMLNTVWLFGFHFFSDFLPTVAQYEPYQLTTWFKSSPIQIGGALGDFATQYGFTGVNDDRLIFRPDLSRQIGLYIFSFAAFLLLVRGFVSSFLRELPFLSGVQDLEIREKNLDQALGGSGIWLDRVFGIVIVIFFLDIGLMIRGTPLPFDALLNFIQISSLISGLALSLAGLVAVASRLSSIAKAAGPFLDLPLDVTNYLASEKDGGPIKSRTDALMQALWKEYDSVVVVAHSLGTVVMSDYFINSKAEREKQGKKTYFLTMGSPLKQLILPRLPYRFSWLQKPDAELPVHLGVEEWKNVYCAGDYVGRKIFEDDKAAQDGAHTQYWKTDFTDVVERLQGMVRSSLGIEDEQVDNSSAQSTEDALHSREE